MRLCHGDNCGGGMGRERGGGGGGGGWQDGLREV